jgi:hypothetical protein
MYVLLQLFGGATLRRLSLQLHKAELISIGSNCEEVVHALLIFGGLYELHAELPEDICIQLFATAATACFSKCCTCIGNVFV